MVRLHRRDHWVHYGCFRPKVLPSISPGGIVCPGCGDPVDTSIPSLELNFAISLKLDVVRALRKGDVSTVVRLIQRYGEVDLREAMREGMAFRVDKALRTVFNPFGRKNGLPRRSHLYRQLTELPKTSNISNLDYLLVCVVAADEYEMARALLEAGASPAGEDDQALLAAVELASGRLFRLLMGRRSAKVPVSGRVQFRAAALDRAGILQFLIRLGVCDHLGTALEWALQERSERACKAILLWGKGRRREDNIEHLELFKYESPGGREFATKLLYWYRSV